MIFGNLTDKLAKMKREAEERDAQRKAVNLNLKYVDLSKTPVVVEALALVDEKISREARLAVIEKKRNKLAVVCVDPASPAVKKVLDDFSKKGYEYSVFVVSLSGLEHAFNFYKYAPVETEKITGKVEVEDVSKLKKELSTLGGFKEVLEKQEFESFNAASVFKIILAGALLNRASDVHFEPTGKNIKLRLRIDGLLRDVFILKSNFYQFLVSRVKLLSGLKLNISDKPQDGRFTIQLAGKDVEVRVALAPSEFGEVIVMRLLDPDSINLSLKDLGLRDDDLEIIQKNLERPDGLILNTGPTGSGKTTTLYTFLKTKKSPEIKIITIEDPIEYHLDGIEQTQVDEEAGYTFASGLKSLMRQDPDVILVGEIRDKETAEIGIQASLTGHLVFSTIHANRSAGAIPRLLDLGVKNVSIGPALKLIIAQRLVRRLCQNCKVEANSPAGGEKDLENNIKKFLDKLPKRVDKGEYKDIKIFEPKGCDNCLGMGYKGRVAIYELLEVGSEVEELISKQAGETAINKFAVDKGMTTMQQDGILKVISGITTFDEIKGVTGPIEWE